MSAPTIYRWDDPGAPDLNTIMPTSNDKDKLLVHTVLKACLIDGYGSKAAAGWSMPHEEITSDGCRFVLKNAANSGALLYEGGAFSGGATDRKADTLWVCGEVVDFDAITNGWSWKVSYDQRYSSAGRREYHKTGFRNKYACDAWVVIANENLCVMMVGTSSGEFSLSNGAGSRWSSGMFAFGAMIDSTSNMASPATGNFYIEGGGTSNYAGYSYPVTNQNYLLTTNLDILRMDKASAHSYLCDVSRRKTHSPLSAWLPVPRVYMQYGPSFPGGSSIEYLHFLAAVPSKRYLKLEWANKSLLNAFMTSNGFEYGKPFSYYGGDWIVLKTYYDIVVFSLESGEWGV